MRKNVQKLVHSEEIGGSEELLDRVLTGLRDAEAPGGLERRVLAAVRNRASSSSVGRRASGGWVWAGGVRAAALAAIVLAAGWFGFAIHQSARESAASNQLASSPKAVSTVAPKAIAARVQRARLIASQQTQVRKRGRPAEASTGSDAATPDAIALRETRTPSQPAPEMPLTAQEELLQRIVHAGDPVELAALDPQARAARFAEDRAQFHKFFDRHEYGDHK